MSIFHNVLPALAAGAVLAVSPLHALAGLVFTEVEYQAGIDVVHDSRGFVTGGQELQNMYGSGVAWVDINHDGWLDLFVGNGATGNYFFINNGDGTFEDLADVFNVRESRVTDGIAFADVDNDGFMDLMIGNYYAEPQFFRGGPMKMQEQGELYGVNPLLYDPIHPPPMPVTPESMGVAFGDFDQDGWVDLYVANYVKQPDMLLQSLGGGYFLRTTKVELTEEAYGFTAVFWDFDNDLDQDIYVANDFGYNYLFENQGRESGWEFVEKAPIYKIDGGGRMEVQSMGMGLAVGDWDNDLDLDLFLTNYWDNSFFENLGPVANGIWRFREEAAELGVDYEYSGWGCALEDLDLDGDLDLLQASGAILSKHIPQPIDLHDKCWLNDGPPDYHFTEVSDEVEFNEDMMGRALATGDFDRDGDIDVVVSNNTFYDPAPDAPDFVVYYGRLLLYRNDQDTGNHWLNLTLEGGGQHRRGLGCNRSAIGARVYVTAGGLTQMREVRCGESFLSQHSLELEFGLGSATSVDEVRVRWICGAEEIFGGVSVDRCYRLVEGASRAIPLAAGLMKFEAQAMTDGIRLQWAVAPGVDVARTRIYRGMDERPEGMIEVDLEVVYDDRTGWAFDQDVVEGQRYTYRIRVMDTEGTAIDSGTIFATAGVRSSLPGRPAVGQNYPNPFNPSTSIRFEVPETMEVRLVLYDAQGRRIRTLYQGTVPSGTHTVEWDGRDDAGQPVASGTYAYALITDRGTSARQLTLVR
jgi:hypothetical protein